MTAKEPTMKLDPAEALKAARDIFEIELKINRLSPVDAFEAAMAEYAASLPQSQDIRGLVEELRAGLDGLPPGPWFYSMYAGVCHKPAIPPAKGGDHELIARTAWGPDEDDDSTDWDAANRLAQHIARCSPENIAKLLDALSCLAGEGWRPIASAPISNGSKTFLVYIPGHGQAVGYALVAGEIRSSATGFVMPKAKLWRDLPPAPSVEEKLP